MDDEISSVPVEVISNRKEISFILRLIGETVAMVRFYSRLPLPALGRFDDPANPPPFARACRMLPVASLVIALPPALTVLSLGMTALPPLVVGTIVIAVAILTTGALHEDGLADMVDGFGGGRDLAQKLAIMKDSRLGSYGAAALMLALMARVALVSALLGHSPLLAALSLVAAAILSRTLSLGLFAALPGARANGVASAVGRPEPSAIAVACGLAIVLVLIAAVPGLGIARAGLGIVAAVLGTALLGRVAMAQIGGQTGDVLGAAQLLAEIGFLAGTLLI